MGIFGTSKLKLFAGDKKVKKAYLGTEKIYSAGNIVVTYHVDSGVTYQEEVDSDTNCLKPTTFTPTKSGYTFVGWREDIIPNPYILPSKVLGKEPIVLYAVFTKEVTVYTYDEQERTQNGNVYYNNGNVSPAEIITYECDGTYSNFRGYKQFNTLSDIEDYLYPSDEPDIYGPDYLSIQEDTYLVALYSHTVTLSYYNNSTTKQTKTGTRYIECYNHAAVNPTFTLSQASKSGWTARGWATGTAGNASVAYSSISGTEFYEDTTVYGLYYKTCTLTCKSYNKSEDKTGTAYYNSAGNTVGANVTAPTGASYSGWTWRGWSSGGVTLAGGDVAFANGDTVGLGTDNHTIYGLYYQTIYLYYNGNGSTGGSVSTQDGTAYYNAYGNTLGHLFTLASNGYSRKGYTFNGWDLGAVGATVRLSTSTTAYAQWADNAWTWVNNYVGSGDTLTIDGGNLDFNRYGRNTFQVYSNDVDDDAYGSSHYYTNTVSTRGCKYVTVTMTGFGNIASYLDCDMMYLADANGNKIASFGFSESQGWDQTVTKTLDCSAYSSIQLRGYFNDYQHYGSAIYISTVRFHN